MNKVFSTKISHLEKSVIRDIFDRAPESSVNLGLGMVQFPFPEELRNEAKIILEKTQHFHYSPNAGLAELRLQISSYYNNRFNYKQTCITNGAEEALYVVINSLVNKGDLVLLANPYFSAYKTISKISGARTYHFSTHLSDNFFAREVFLNAIKKKPKCIILNHPLNPTGQAFSESDIRFILTQCKKYNVIPIIDEVYLDLYLEERIPSFSEFSDDVIIISSLSKSYLIAGWRLGWIAGPQKFIDKFILLHQYIATCAPLISQKLAISTLKKFREEIPAKIRGDSKKNKNALIAILNKQDRKSVV